MKLEDTISDLKLILPAQDFILTGSFVLAKYGLRPWDTVADLDIILVKPEITTIEMLNRLMKERPAVSTAKLNALTVPKIKEESHEHAKYNDPDDEDIPVKSKLEKKFGMVAKAQTKSVLQAIFLFNHVKVDVFIENDFNEVTLTVELENKMACKLTLIPHIVQAKKGYGKMKDWLQCRDMAKLIFDQTEFDQKLVNWKDMLRSNYPDK